MRRLSLALSLFAAMSLSSPAMAAPPLEKVKKTVQAVANQDVVKVEKSKITGLYEVHTASQLFYTDEKGEYVLFGSHVFSTKDNSNYTEKRMGEIAGYKFSDLPLKDAIKIVRGDGSRTLVTIEDPNCGYCKQFTKTIEQAGNVTHYVFLVGILGAESTTKARNIWCSPNPAQSWRDWMLDGKVPAEAQCEAPLERNGQMMGKYRMFGTPAVLFKNGDRAAGALPLAELEKRFARQPK